MITGENLSSSVTLSIEILHTDYFKEFEMFSYRYFAQTLILMAVMSINRPLAGL